MKHCPTLFRYFICTFLYFKKSGIVIFLIATLLVLPKEARCNTALIQKIEIEQKNISKREEIKTFFNTTTLEWSRAQIFIAFASGDKIGIPLYQAGKEVGTTVYGSSRVHLGFNKTFLNTRFNKNGFTPSLGVAVARSHYRFAGDQFAPSKKLFDLLVSTSVCKNSFLTTLQGRQESSTSIPDRATMGLSRLYASLGVRHQHGVKNKMLLYLMGVSLNLPIKVSGEGDPLCKNNLQFSTTINNSYLQKFKNDTQIEWITIRNNARIGAATTLTLGKPLPFHERLSMNLSYSKKNTTFAYLFKPSATENSTHRFSIVKTFPLRKRGEIFSSPTPPLIPDNLSDFNEDPSDF